MSRTEKSANCWGPFRVQFGDAKNNNNNSKMLTTLETDYWSETSAKVNGCVTNNSPRVLLIISLSVSEFNTCIGCNLISFPTEKIMDYTEAHGRACLLWSLVSVETSKYVYTVSLKNSTISFTFKDGWPARPRHGEFIFFGEFYSLFLCFLLRLISSSLFSLRAVLFFLPLPLISAETVHDSYITSHVTS